MVSFLFAQSSNYCLYPRLWVSGKNFAELINPVVISSYKTGFQCYILEVPPLTPIIYGAIFIRGGYLVLIRGGCLVLIRGGCLVLIRGNTAIMLFKKNPERARKTYKKIK